MVYEKIKEEKNLLYCFAFGAGVGAFIFICIYGTSIINVCRDSWLYNSGDLTQHYLGWKFYRNSDWNFPIGLIDNIRWPEKVSIIYTDSIPIVALFFKCLSPILPDTFQYFGLYGVFCFMMQGGIAALIIRKKIHEKTNILFSTLFFVTMPILIYRMYYHTALASHWIILLAILFLLYRNRINTVKKTICIWTIMGVLAVGIHSYYIGFVGIILIISAGIEFVENKDVKKILIEFISFGTSVLLSLFCFGAFYGDFSSTAGGLHTFNSNLNTFINPLSKSSFIKDMMILQYGQNEGMAYLGIGLVFLILLYVVLFLSQKNKSLSTPPEKILRVQEL